MAIRTRRKADKRCTHMNIVLLSAVDRPSALPALQVRAQGSMLIGRMRSVRGDYLQSRRDVRDAAYWTPSPQRTRDNGAIDEVAVLVCCDVSEPASEEGKGCSTRLSPRVALRQELLVPVCECFFFFNSPLWSLLDARIPFDGVSLGSSQHPICCSVVAMGLQPVPVRGPRLW
jgi:hypothetical protein